MNFDARPIGVFDSGIGGLTVLRELIHDFPQEMFIYLGDLARLPYGSKSPDTIRKYSEQNLEFLKNQDVKAIVIACNSASAQFRESEYKGIPVYNVIGPGAARAYQRSESKRIGVLATRATVASQAYTQELKKIDPAVQVFDMACPLFVPLAEEGWDADPVTNLIVYRYVSQLLPHQIDTVILGCTHYPLLKNSISRATGSAIELVDSGEAVSALLKKDFEEGRLLQAPVGSLVQVKILTTDLSSHFNDLAQKILRPLKVTDFELVQT